MQVTFGYSHPLKKIATSRGCHCPICGEQYTFDKPATFDHIIPHSKHGNNSPYNGFLDCGKCNNERGTKEFGTWLNSVADWNILKQGLQELISLDKLYVKIIRSKIEATTGRRLDLKF